MEKRKKETNKLFIVKKYIMAKSATEAIRKDRYTKIDDVWVDEDWKKGRANHLASAIGFLVSD